MLPVGIGTNKISPPSPDLLPPDDILDSSKWKVTGPRGSIIDHHQQQNVILGPGQIQPKGYRLTSGRYGELKLSFIMTKGMLEVEVSFLTRNAYIFYMYAFKFYSFIFNYRR